MGNGACHQQVPSIDEVNLVARNFKQQQFDPCNSQCMLPLLNSQSQSPSKPTIESKNPTIARLDEEEFEILMTNEDKPDEDLSPVRESKFTRAQSPTKVIKSKNRYKQEENYFLEQLKEDKTNLARRKSSEKQLSPVKVIHSSHQKKHNTALLIHSPDQRSTSIIKMNRLSCQLDEAVILSLEPKSILKSIGSEKSITNSQKSKNNSQKRVRFGLVYRQYK
ncbi:unnamed protein product [Paramecium primaurelia]|uniref:Uncharacterized protein n=1 Tax=Paramecium primaurelia TaxID=5886 RepID=A0A8S1PGV5_PARPR|nr:unnamed protein product [Paramecium primaurelia]